MHSVPRDVTLPSLDRYSAKRVHLNECSYHVPGMDTVLSGCTSYHVPGMDTVLSGCSYHLAGMDTVLSGCT